MALQTETLFDRVITENTNNERKMFRQFGKRFTARTTNLSRSVLERHNAKDRLFNTRVRKFNTGNTSGGAGTQALGSSNMMTGAMSGLLLLGGGYYMLKNWNQPVVHGEYNDGTERTSIVSQSYGKEDDLTKTIHPSVQEYLKGTYKYVALNIGLTALSAVAAFRTGAIYKLASMSPLMNLLVVGGGSIGTMIGTRMIDQNRSPLLKHTFWAGFNAFMGLSICTIGLMYEPQIILRAALYSGGIFGALSFTAMNAQQEKFLNMGGPLMAGLVVVFLSSLTPLFLPAQYARALAISEAIWLYGGLLVFGGLTLYDTQRVMQKGKNYLAFRETQLNRGVPERMIPQPDYINASIGLYLDLINIFIRMVQILGGSSRRK